VVPLSETLLRHRRPGDAIVHYDVALPSMVFYVRQHVEMTFDREAFLAALRAPAAAMAVLPADGYDAMRGELAGTCVLDRRPTADVKLREVLSGAPPPAVLLISTRCPP
jgi:hypothetical protein